MSKSLKIGLWAVLMLVVQATFLTAQSLPREGNDAIWARSTAGASLTLDGVLNEAAWSQAETVPLVFGQSTGLPTSGWQFEFQQAAARDFTNATARFLTTPDNYLWMAFEIPDSSIGGSQDWPLWDGILMSIKDHSSADRPVPAREFFYTWWYVNVDPLIAPGTPPRFIGHWGNFDDTTRTAGQRAAWDARTIVNGTSNEDTSPDVGWTVEMRVSLDSLGYDATRPQGDAIGINFSIWDVDWLYAGDPNITSVTRTDWQSPWGNANLNNTGRVYARPDVTISSGSTPAAAPDARIPNGMNEAAPLIDGDLNDAYWAYAYTFDMKWDDAAVRATYPGMGAFQSGQFQPPVGGGTATVTQPADATIKMFFRGDFLYLAADVRDELVQGTTVFDELDAVKFTIADRSTMDGDGRLQSWQFMAGFDSTGAPSEWDNLAEFVGNGTVQYAMVPKGNTTINDFNDIDEGFVLEMAIDLTGIGYPTGLGDHVLFLGVMLGDGDSFQNPALNYGTRTWWFREHGGGPAYPWLLMDEAITGIGDEIGDVLPTSVELFGNYPNPFNPTTTIRYAIPVSGSVEVVFYNVIGQEVHRIHSSSQAAGEHSIEFDARDLSSGIYFYNVQLNLQSGNGELTSRTQKMMLLK